MSTARYIVGDVRAVMAELPDASVDLVFTSPPFLNLRSYLDPDDPAKALEIGNEPDPASFVDTLLELTAEWRRVLAPHGSLCVELGDTMSGSGGAGGDYNDGGLREGQRKFSGSARRRDEHGVDRPTRKGRRSRADDVEAGVLPAKGSGEGWPLRKSLALIPELYRLGLVYGLTLSGKPSPAGLWRARNVVTWCRPNPTVGDDGDKYRRATSDMVVACVNDRRWWDVDAVRTPLTEPGRAPAAGQRRLDESRGRQRDRATVTPQNESGTPPYDWWLIAPGGYSGAHFAVFPPELVRVPLQTMCPRRVCRTCGTPSSRLVKRERLLDGQPADLPPISTTERAGAGATGIAHSRTTTRRTLLGWSTCGCPGADGLEPDGFHTGTGWRPGLVLDPFAGSGTTLMVASGHGRDSVGIDLNRENARLARERVGMFLEVVGE